MTHSEIATRITLDYLELFCLTKDLLISCGQPGDEIWISPFGSSAETYDDILDALEISPEFELVPIFDTQDSGYYLSRLELEEQLKTLVN